ncbi:MULTISPECIES: ankyrin repeat domain-containing protein [unclassified Legionella]|uniref:ankyrin repeat domain-containing protein n=1 Tax=unclassified Legionella TaxID=2622702 RepID=UPI001054D7AE|nr:MULTISPECIES: ankyrin repeat domain-containing protein [unclassified Legionella]MDI9819321.1 ankyrin repeat domain-containing protein [Legionella sp. PL877]
MKFSQLYEKLKIDSLTPEGKHQAFEQWCGENVSRDLRFSGSVDEQYNQYMNLAKAYLDEFLPNASGSLNKPVAFFDDNNPLEVASLHGLDRAIVSLAPGPEVLNAVNPKNGMTALHYAALSGHVNTVTVLLSMDADVRKANNHLQLPIFSALVLPVLQTEDLKKNKMAVFRLLKEKAPETLGKQDRDGNTVIHQMAVHGFSDLLPEVLETQKSLIYINNYHGHYPIHTAILNNKLECVRILLNQDNVTALEDGHGETPLHYAVRHGGKEILELFYSDTNVLDPRDFLGKTPLMLAAEKGNLEAVKGLIGKGARVDLADTQGATVLHYALYNNNADIARWLIENTTVNINAADSVQTPLKICEDKGLDNIRDLLLEKGAVSEVKMQL